MTRKIDGIDPGLRTLLTVLSEVIDLLLETELDPDQRELAETGKAVAEDLAQRLDRLPDRPHAPGPAPNAAGNESRRPPPLKVLLAEDNLLNQKLVVSILHNRGHRVVVAQNGREAVEFARKEPFDLILMDLRMPVMDGLEATRQIRAREEETGAPRTPVVAVTAHVLEEEKDRCFCMDMDGFVGKPIRRNEFLDTVEGVVGVKPVEETMEPVEEGNAVLDRATFMSIVGGNMELVKELIGLYWDSLPNQMAKLREALDAGDAKGCQYWAHALKGMSLNLSARQTADIALEMELMGKNGDLSGAEEIWHRLAASVDRLREATDGILAETDGTEPG